MKSLWYVRLQMGQVVHYPAAREESIVPLEIYISPRLRWHPKSKQKKRNTSFSSARHQDCNAFLAVCPKAKSCSVVFDDRRSGRWGEIAELNPSHKPGWTLSVPPLLSSPRRYWYTRNAYENKSVYKTHIKLTPLSCEPRPRSWKYVRRSLVHSHCTWRPIVDLSLPTLAALVVTRSLKSASRIWPSSQKRSICQNL